MFFDSIIKITGASIESVFALAQGMSAGALVGYTITYFKQ